MKKCTRRQVLREMICTVVLERIKPRVVAVLLAIGGVGAACAELPAINSNQCGNRIIESPEDCDTFAPAGAACEPPGNTNECHFDCKGPAQCPPTYTCGAVDKICRQSSGTFVSSQTIFAEASTLTFADFDGDGREDALTSGVNDVRIHYFDGQLSLSKTLLLPIINPKYHVGAVGNDTNGDLTVYRNSGLIDIFRGLSDRTVAPVVYSSVPIPNTHTSARAFIVRNQIAYDGNDSLLHPTGDDILAFGSDPKGLGVILDVAGRAQGSIANSVIAAPLGTVAQIAGNVAVGGFIEGSVCDQFVIGFSGDGKVNVYSPCRLAPPAAQPPYEVNTLLNDKGLPDARYVPPVSVTFPLGVTVGTTLGALSAGAFAIDVNSDGHLDLMTAATLGGVTRMYVAYGTGLGTFCSSPTLSVVDNAALEFTPISSTIAGSGIDSDAGSAKKTPVPLAIGDLNHDGVPDFVFPNEIVFSELGADGGPGVEHYSLGPSSVGPLMNWTSAVIADLNHDGIADVAAANPDGAIDFFLGTNNTSMSYMSYGLDGLPGNLVVGDFDGDLTNDLAFSVSGVAGADGGAPTNEVQVMFGQGETFPALPTTLGTLSTVLQLASGPLTSAYTGAAADTNASVSSMIALSIDASSNVFAAILVGNPDRLITSSFALFASPTQRASAVRGIAGPFVTAGENDQMILATDPTGSYALWNVLATGEAALDSTNLFEGPALPGTTNWTNATMAGAYLDSTSGLETSLILAGTTPGGQAQMFVVDPKTLALSPPIAIPCDYETTSPLQERAADFDGDGNRDVLIYCPTVNGSASLTMFWGDGTTTLDASRSTAVPLPGDPVVSFADYRTGPVIQRAVALLTANAVYVTTPGGSDGRTFSPLTKDPTLPGGTLINAADIDGDGVADVAIVDSTKTQVQFFRGIPIHDSPSVP